MALPFAIDELQVALRKSECEGGREIDMGQSMTRTRKRLTPLLAAFTAWAVCISPAFPACAVEPVNREYLIKAAYLLNFIRYIEWPSSFKPPEKPVIIGVLRPDPLSDYLKQAVQSEELSKTVSIVVIEPNESVPHCHILYFPRSLSPVIQQRILKELAGTSVVLVGETEGFLQWGGTINFVILENKVRLEISTSRAEAQGLKISSKLLQVAKVIR